MLSIHGIYIFTNIIVVVDKICPEKKPFEEISVYQLGPVLGVPKSYVRNKFNFQTQRRNVYILLLYIATDEISDIAQLLMFIRGIYLNFNVFKEFSEVYSTKGTFTKKNFFTNIDKTFKKFN